VRLVVDNPRAQPMTAFQERLGRVAVRWMTGVNTAAYRLSNGRVAAHVPGGAPICLLTTTGRRTGRPRTVPLLYLPHDDAQIVLVASHGGMSSHPAWYLNLLADPEVTVDVASRRRRMTGRPASESERAELWPALTAVYPHFDAYQSRTDRIIPVLILAPMSDP
jgi:deazaflavin-dependent oxidoreductase (nitroreductase family)